ncbi:glycosyltransferase [Planctomycetota bacterium]|nr:glycosyltransferase [Planctomycetota bacterium]
MTNPSQTYPRPGDPTVAVVVCCFNAASTIGETLLSIRAQTYSAFELLVIDDGSSDGTVPVVLDYCKVDERARLVENGINRGTAFTRQRALELVEAELVMFVDADDLAAPTLLERYMRRFREEPRLIGLGCYATYFRELGVPLGVQACGPTTHEEFTKLYNGNKLIFMANTTLFRRSDALEVGGYRQRLMPNDRGVRYEDYAEDLDLWCRLADKAEEGYYLSVIPEALMYYRKPEGSLSTASIPLMQLRMRWVKDCLVRRRSGNAEQTLADFLDGRTAWQRLGDWRSDQAAAAFKRAAFAYSNKQILSMFLPLIWVAVMSPSLISQKARTQRRSR